MKQHACIKPFLSPAKFPVTPSETLDLSVNKFASFLDPRIDRFKNLTKLQIQKNGFVGAIPSSMKKLTNLEELEMGTNPGLTGPLLSYSVHWPNLKFLDISETLCTGSIPSEIGLLTGLTSLGFWDVPLSGSIPTEVGHLTSMRKYTLSNRLYKATALLSSPLPLFLFLSPQRALLLGKNTSKGVCRLKLACGMT